MGEDCDSSELESLFATPKDENTTSYFQKAKGILAAFAYVPLLVISSTGVQLLQRQIPDLELNAIRFGTAGILFSIAIIIATGKLPVVPISEIKSVMGMGTVTFCSTIAIFTGVTYVPLSTAQSIYLSSCLVCGVILFAIVLDEKIAFKSVLFVTFCCSGVLLVIQPGFIFSANGTKPSQNLSENVLITNETNTTTNYEKSFEIESDTFLEIFGCILSAISGLCTSTNIVLVKKRSFLQEHMMETLFWLYWMCAIVSAILMLILEKPTLPDDSLQYLYVALHCISYVFMWPIYMFAARYISGTTINMIVTTSVVFMLIPQYTVLSSILPGKRNWMEIVGVFLVLLGSSLRSFTDLRGTNKDTVR